MRSTGIVLSCTLALALAAFAYWFLSPDRCSPLPRRARATDQDSHVAAAKSGSTGEVADGRDDRAAARHREEGEPTPSAATLRVRVRDDTGAPLAGVCVGVLKPAEPNRCGVVESPLEFVDGTEASTTETGECEVTLPDASAIVDVAATVPGFAAGFWSRARVGDRIELELQHAIELTGFVRDRLGTPVAGARVSWSCLGPRRSFGETTSAADGSYRLVDVVEIAAPSFFADIVSPWIEVHADGFAELRFWSREVVERPDERHWKLDLWPLHGGRLRGRVVDQVTKVPVAGAEVFLRAAEDSTAPHLRTRSGADGTFLLDRVPAFGVQNAFPLRDCWNAGVLGDLCVVAEGHGSAWQRIRAPEDEEDLEFDFELPPVCEVRGRVVDEHGEPIPGATIEPHPQDGAHEPLSFDFDHRFELDDPAALLRADRDGRYVVRDFPALAGVDAAASIWADGSDAAGGEIRRSCVAVTPVAGVVVAAPDIVLRAPVERRRCSLHFVDESGRDLPRASYCRLTDESDPCLVYCMEAREGRADSTGRGSLPVSDSSSESGRAVRVVVRNEGFATVVVDVPNAATETTITLRREHRLHGIVRDVDGRPGRADVCASAVSDSQSGIPDARASAPTSSTSGRFVLRGLSAGPWRITAVHRNPDGTAETAIVDDLMDEERDVEIVLERSGEPRRKYWWEPGAPPDPSVGCVEVALDLAGSRQPVLHADLILASPRNGPTHARPVAPGRFLFEHVEPGDAELKVVVESLLTTRRPVTVDAGVTTQIAIEIEPCPAIGGRIALDELPKWYCLELIAIDTTCGEHRSYSVAADGSFRLRGLDPTRSYRLALDISVEGSPALWWLCGDPPRRATDADAVWHPRFSACGAITVKGRTSDLLPDDTVVHLLDDADRSLEVRIANQTNCPVLFSVLPGAYLIRLDLPDGTTQEQRVTVGKPGEPTPVVFDLK